VYDFWDNGAGGGHWSVNGVAKGSNQEILVNASQISQVTYQAGAGTDTIFLRASDGLHFGAWTQGDEVIPLPGAATGRGRRHGLAGALPRSAQGHEGPH
jgi:hypothetical protein